MWASASDALLAARPDARWYAEKLAVDEGALRAAGVELFTIDLVRDPREHPCVSEVVSRRRHRPLDERR